MNTITINPASDLLLICRVVVNPESFIKFIKKSEIRKPPKRVPNSIETTVVDSNQPFAKTNLSGGSSSVNIPYLAGAYEAAPNPTTA